MTTTESTPEELAFLPSTLCRTCLRPIVHETRTEPGFLPREAWYDDCRIDAITCFKAADYCHVPMTDRERAYYEAGARAALAAGYVDPAPIRALLASEIADSIEGRVRAARGDVRCLDCNLRYDERQEYGCHESGRGHSFDEGDLVAAEEIERSEPVEHVTLSVADLRAALGLKADEAGEQVEG